MSYRIYRADGPAGFYIGLTSRPLKERMYEHFNDAKRRPANRPFCAALNKYGKEQFDWQILIDGLTKDEAEHLETFLISTLKPRYNVSSGGESGNGGQLSRAVICINTGHEYATGKEAASENGVSQMTVSLLCRNGGQTKAGLRFRFADADEVIRKPRAPELIEAGRRARVEKLKARRHPPETIKRMRAAAKKRGVSVATRAACKANQQKPIVCVETGTVFPDAGMAGLAHGLPRNTVYDLLYNGRVSREAFVSFRRALPGEAVTATL